MAGGGRQTTMWPAPRCEECGCPLLPLLSPRQVAEALQVSRQTVYNLCRRGRLDWSRVGKGIRVRHASVHAMLDRAGPDPDWWVKMEQVKEGV